MDHCSQVATLLMESGFMGVFQDYARTPALNKETSTPWPTYSQPHLPGIVFPPTLEVGSHSFTLTLPSMTHDHIITLMKCYGRSVPEFSLLVSLVYIWLKSWNVSEIRPLTVALMVITFLQVSDRLRVYHNCFLTSHHAATSTSPR